MIFSTAVTLFETAQTGNWHVPGTWVNGAVPGSNDTAVILNTHVVTATGAVTVGITNINSGGTLQLDGTNDPVPFYLKDSGKIINAGTLQVTNDSNAVTLGVQSGTGFVFSGTDIDYNTNKIFFSSVVYHPTMNLASGETVELSGNTTFYSMDIAQGASLIQASTSSPS